MGRRKEVDDPWSSDLSLPIGSVMTGMLSLPFCWQLASSSSNQRTSSVIVSVELRRRAMRQPSAQCQRLQRHCCLFQAHMHVLSYSPVGSECVSTSRAHRSGDSQGIRAGSNRHSHSWSEDMQCCWKASGYGRGSREFGTRHWDAQSSSREVVTPAPIGTP